MNDAQARGALEADTIRGRGSGTAEKEYWPVRWR